MTDRSPPLLVRWVAQQRKKLGRIGRVGHRITGDRRSRMRGIGWEYVHVAIDDASRCRAAETKARGAPRELRRGAFALVE